MNRAEANDIRTRSRDVNVLDSSIGVIAGVGIVVVFLIGFVMLGPSK